MSIISQEEVLKVAKLARINLSEQEQEKFAKDLSGILEHFQDLSQLDVSEVEAVNFLKMEENQVRPDAVIEATDEEKERIRQQFPQREGDFFKVKAVL